MQNKTKFNEIGYAGAGALIRDTDGLMAEWFCSYLRVLFFSEGRLKELFLFGPQFGFRIIREFVVGLCCLIGAGAQEV